jgi:hypothetical protein
MNFTESKGEFCRNANFYTVKSSAFTDESAAKAAAQPPFSVEPLCAVLL